MRKIVKTLLIIVMALSLVACVGKELPTGGQDKPTDSTETENNNDQSKDEKSAAPAEKLVLADALNFNIALGNNQRTITYNQVTPLTLPDGTVIAQGDLKPTWQYIQQQLGIEINDVAVQDQKATEMIDISAATGFTNANVYGGNSIAEKLMSYGAQGYFINLKDYLDYMPNFSSYLSQNPDIASAITAYDGGIYHIPYVAEINNYARVFHGREDWVKLLLDSDEKLLGEKNTIEAKYEGYWTNRNATNVIQLQNKAAKGGKLSRDDALNVLLSYIADTYPELNKPSELYLGETAKYDIDELVALWRVVELSPNTLSAAATGKAVSGAEISPFFVRKAKYREDVLRLAVYFGGQRVYGSDSYGSRFYLDENGELSYSYAEDKFLEALDHIEDIYAEGLIHTEFADLSNKDDFRKELYTKDLEEGHKQFGFMTFDWIASTTASNKDVVGMLPPVTTIGSDEFVHFVENTRVIKPDGWSISTKSSKEEINAAITVFDYFFSEEGHRAQNYGVPQNLEEGEVFVAVSGKEYPKFNQWLLDTAGELKNGDVSGFLRDFMGSHIPIGYQKEIGFELQYTKNHGWEAWELYESIGVLSTSYDADKPLFRLVPPVFSLTEQDTARLANIAIGEDQVDLIFLYLTGADKAINSTDLIKETYKDSGIDTYIEVYKEAYGRMVR